MGLFDSLPPPSASKTAQPGDFKRRADNASNEVADHTDAKRLKREDSTPQQLPLQGVQVHLTCVPLSAAFSEDKGSRLTMEGEEKSMQLLMRVCSLLSPPLPRRRLRMLPASLPGILPTLPLPGFFSNYRCRSD